MPNATTPPHNAPAPTAADPSVERELQPWIPIRSLAERHRPRILEHLRSLSDRDRYLRFGALANDDHLARYVAGLNFVRDEIYGVFNRRLQLIAMAHLACPSAGHPRHPVGTAEFGGSVLERNRGRGHGARLFEHAMLHARNRGIANFYIHALSENAAMLRIARKAGAAVVRDGPESEAFLKLPPETLASHVEQFVADGAAAIDYRYKKHSKIVGAVIDAIGEIRDGVRGTEHSSQE